MQAYKTNIERKTRKNKYYRRVVFTTPQLQLVLMSLNKNEEIGREKHKRTTQFIRVEKGHAKAIIGRKTYLLKDGDAIIIPPNRYHNIINTGAGKLKLYTLYSPPEHPKNRVQIYKSDK